MAGGPLAAVAPCMYCASASDRIVDGIEDDQYRCLACGREHIVCFCAGPATAPLWPISPEHASKLLELSRERDANLRHTGPARPVPDQVVGGRFVRLRGLGRDAEAVLPVEDYPLRGNLTIGRHPDCDVQILSRSLRREHASIERRTDHIVVRDIETGAETCLAHGDVIQLGDVHLRFLADDE